MRPAHGFLSGALPRSPLFWSGLALRLVLAAALVPVVRAGWFAPFFSFAVENPSSLLDPWTGFLASGGDPMAFPYGAAMFVPLYPFAALGILVGGLFGASSVEGAAYGLAAAALCLDFAVFAAARGFIRPSSQDGLPRLLRLLWLSPISLYVGFVHGQLDALPVFFLLVSVAALLRLSPKASALFLALAVSAKPSMAVAAPFMLLWLANDERRSDRVPVFLAAAAASALLLLAPLFLSPGWRTMGLGTQEALKVFEVSIPLGRGLAIFAVPLAILAVLAQARAVLRPTEELLRAHLACAFLVLVLLTPASPGWFLWPLPFLALHASPKPRRFEFLVHGFSLAFLALHALRSPGAAGAWAPFPMLVPLPPSASFAADLFLTVAAAAGLLLGARMWREAHASADRYGLSKRACLVAVAGDSGAGKDTLVDAVAALFGEPSVSRVSGDDYHLWDRHEPMWRALTHLNPRANDLRSFSAHALDLLEGRSVRWRHYDHATGLFTPPRSTPPRRFVLASGLHALFLPDLRRRAHLRIFLSMDEDLRRCLKIRRDVHVRGHAMEKVVKSIERRSDDAGRFVHPQEASADIVFSLQPVNPDFVDPKRMGVANVPMKLRIVLRSASFGEELVRGLVGLCGLHVDVVSADWSEGMEIVVEGDAVGEDFHQLARILVPDSDHLLAVDPVWEGGPLGVMQLISFAALAGRLDGGRLSTEA